MHDIDFKSPVIDGKDPDFEFKGPLNLFAQIVNNLIDNSIYWTDWRRQKEGSIKKGIIALRTLPNWIEDGPCLAVIDNGPGFKISLEKAVKAFYTTKLDGLGLGLFFAKLGMESQGGRLIFVNPDELSPDVNEGLDGAAVLLCFPGEKS